MTSALLYLLCRCIKRKRKRQNQLAAITPKTNDPRLSGVRADQPIQFVVPSTVLINETTGESPSDTDYSSSVPRYLPIIPDRQRKRKTAGYHINPEDLERRLYVDVASSFENGAFLGDLGKIGFSLHYNSLKNYLSVHIIGAKDLPCLLLKTTANPSVKVVLLPDRSPKYITKVQKNTANPVFNETFRFSITKKHLYSKKLKISVWDYDRFSRKLLVGQIIYSLKDSGLTNVFSTDAATGEIWVDLKQDRDSRLHSVGELLLALCYNPSTASLTMSVLKARGLIMSESEKEMAIYAKVTLYVRRTITRTKKTSSKSKAPEIEFNNSFHIHVPPKALNEIDLLVSLCERTQGIGSKRVIGRAQVGSNCLSDQGLQHWQDMLLSPKSTCAQWHVLSGF